MTDVRALLQQLSDLSAADRVFLTVYLSRPQSVAELGRRYRETRKALRRTVEGRDELDHFEENVRLVREHLETQPFTTGALALFAGWAADFFATARLPGPLPDLVWVDSSPYIRPLAQFADDYENMAVVVADNRRARIFMVTAAAAGPAQAVRGNIKNHVRKGGWSQQRYERRRDKQLLLYAKEVVAQLA